MSVSATSPRLFVGTSTPAIRGMVRFSGSLIEWLADWERETTQSPTKLPPAALALALLVLGVLLVDDVDAPLAPDDLVVGGTLLHAGSDFHGSGGRGRADPAGVHL